MTIDELRIEMETELTWRSDELRMLKNNLSSISKEHDKNKYRKSLVVMLYSHFEGFTKICFLIYIKYINEQKIKRKNIKSKPELIASSMNEIFKSYENQDKKNKNFKRQLPEEKTIHTIYRRADLIQQFENYYDELIYIKDDVISTESNLWASVMSKNFYKLGIKHDTFKKSHKAIDRLVNLRNSIAHGSEKAGVSEKIFNELEKIVLKDIMEKLILIFEREARILRC